MAKYKYFRRGAFNYVYTFNDEQDNNLTMVLKIQIIKNDQTDELDRPFRSVKLFNSINATESAKGQTFSRFMQWRFGVKEGWACPFVKGEQATDQEMFDALIDIFNRTGRIIFDAPVPGNFIKKNDSYGTVVCVDVGLAIQLENRDIPFKELTRQKSKVSLEYLKTNGPYKDINYLSYKEQTNLLTIKLLKALVVIKKYRPDIYNVNFLKNNSNLLNLLSTAYDQGIYFLDNPEPFKNVLKELDEVMGNINNECKVELQMTNPNALDVKEPSENKFVPKEAIKKPGFFSESLKTNWKHLTSECMSSIMKCKYI